LLELSRVGYGFYRSGGRLPVYGEVAFGEQGAELIGRCGDEYPKVGGLEVEGHFASFEFGQIEQVIE
jgi:hypothetical protein